jgi:hypothetical protein
MLKLSVNLPVRASYLGCKDTALIPAFSPKEKGNHPPMVSDDGRSHRFMEPL